MQPDESSTFAIRFLRGALYLPLVTAYVLFVALAIIPLVLGQPRVADWLTLAAAVVLPIALTGILRRRAVAPLPRIAIGYAVVLPVLVYLAADDAALLHPVTLNDISPAFPGAEKSFAVLMRYAKRQPLGRDFKAPNRIFKQGPFVGPDKPEAWAKWLAEHRADIEADWADLAPVRAWWDELATFDRIGDLTPGRIDADIMAFAPVRSYSQRAAAIAGLQALDGQGDAAFATLQPLLEVSRRLEPSARTLVRFMIARVMQRMALEAAAFVLDRTTVSPAARARFAAALAGGSGGEAGARRLIGIEYAFGLDAFVDLHIGDLLQFNASENLRAGDWRRELPLHALNFFSPLVFNPRHTFNLLGGLNERRQELAARRAAAKIGEMDQAFFRGEGRPRFKNLAGAMFMLQSTPALVKVTESYWKIEDLRTALRDRLAKM
ncbi:MAG: hypothetical protein HZA93_03670 [Verrucomicrobia bacterium]|nr:hypothetical protein [Verrucomicrobiota bacterium]